MGFAEEPVKGYKMQKRSFSKARDTAKKCVRMDLNNLGRCAHHDGHLTSPVRLHHEISRLATACNWRIMILIPWSDGG
jgi:hypothetical protein